MNFLKLTIIESPWTYKAGIKKYPVYINSINVKMIFELEHFEAQKVWQDIGAQKLYQIEFMNGACKYAILNYGYIEVKKEWQEKMYLGDR